MGSVTAVSGSIMADALNGMNMGRVDSVIIETCPQCGADLQIICYATYSPINAYVCPVCGWRHEERETIERVPFSKEG